MLAAGAASCSASSTGSTGGASRGSGNSDPGCIPSLPTTCKSAPPNAGAAGGQPIASADAYAHGQAQPADMEFGDCSIDLFPPGVGLTPGAGVVLGTGHSYCRIQPWSVTIVMSIQTCSRTVCSEGDFADDPESTFTDNRLPPQAPDYYLLHSDSICKADRHYRVALRVWGFNAVYHNGAKSQGAPFATELKPVTKYGPDETFTKSECNGA
jgi:hypothetical protein